MKFETGDTVEPRAGMGGAWEGDVGVVSGINAGGNTVDVRFPGEPYGIPFAAVELKHSQQKLVLYP